MASEGWGDGRGPNIKRLKSGGPSVRLILRPHPLANMFGGVQSALLDKRLHARARITDVSHPLTLLPALVRRNDDR